MRNKKNIFAVFALIASMVIAIPAFAAGGGGKPAELQKWSFAGVFGTYDTNQLQRGFQVFQEVCASCHSAKLISFRNFGEPGGPEYSEDQIKALAAEYTIIDPELSEGERPATPADRWPSPFETELDAREANNGALPPDFSVLAKARNIAKKFPMNFYDMATAYQEGGADYIYNLLISYEEAPHGYELGDGQEYNAFLGRGLSMMSPLMEELVEYEGTDVPLTVEQYAKDVSAFMYWMADPHLVQRKSIGFIVLIFLSILALMMYLVKRKIWAGVKH